MSDKAILNWELIKEMQERRAIKEPTGWIQLHSGRKFVPSDPRPGDILIGDIAHSLSMQCRFSGHVREFYSVAQHSVLVSYLCGEHAFWGLMHDASEAYLVDLPRPIKRMAGFEEYKRLEEKVMGAICKAFGMDPVEPALVKQADNIMLATEARDLMGPLHPEWKQPVDPMPMHIKPLGPGEAKQLFLNRFYELRPDLKQASTPVDLFEFPNYPPTIVQTIPLGDCEWPGKSVVIEEK
jgi:5'-deoxynucleotidase YfbR-like HD superfamily hydrolase